LECTDIEQRIASWGKAMTAPDVAAVLNVSVKTIFKLTGKGTLPAFRVGNCIRYNPARLAAWVQSTAI
jgi:excisionase family DNA binding protein